MLQVSANRAMPTAAGPIRVDELAGMLPEHAWQKASAGIGSKGERIYSWAFIDLHAEGPGEHDQGRHHLLIRRNISSGELAYHRCYTPRPTTLAALIRVAGQRWRIEESFQSGKGLTRPGPTSSPPLEILAPLDHPGHARPGLPRRGNRRRA